MATHNKTALVVFNPVAGSGGKFLLNAVVDELRALDWQIAIVETEHIGHAEALSASLRGDHCNEPDVLIVAGGDGTVNEVINGLAHIDRLDLPVGLIPIGTVNLLASEINLPRSPQLIAQVISNGYLRNIVLGKISTGSSWRFFLITAGVGFDARSVSRVSPRLKRLNGKLAYIVAGIEEYLLGRWPSFQVIIDGEEFVSRSVLFANGRHYAGRMVWAPDANIETSSLEIGIFARVGRLQLPIYAFGFVSGWFRRFPGAVVRSVAEVRLLGPSTEPVQADGDVVAHLPVSVSVASVSAKILAPGQS